MKNRIFRARAAVPAFSILSLALVSSLHAQSVEVNPVVISASRLPQTLSDLLPSVSVISRQDIEKSQASSLADLLQGEAGFEFGRNGGPGTTTSFFLRGQSSINTVVMIDGVRAQTDKIGAIQITDFPLHQIERIEILKGNASALYGNAAIGGVINVVTRQNKGTPKIYGSITAGARGTAGIFAGYGGSSDDVIFDLSLGRDQSNGFSAMNPIQKKYANADKDGHQNEYASLKLEKKISSDTQIGTRLNYSTLNVDYDSGNSWDLNSDFHKFKKTNQSVSAFVRQVITSSWLSNLSLTRAEYKYQDTLNGTPWPIRGYTNSKLQGVLNGLFWSNTYQINPDTKAVFGVDLIDEKFEGSGSLAAYSLSRNGRGYFAGVTHQIDQWTFEGNLRHDNYRMREENKVAHADYDSTTGLFGLGYKLSPHWKLTGTLSTGFSPPTADAVSSNPNIKPEHHRSHEVGLTYQVQDMLLRTVYFQSKARDAVIYNNNYAYVNGNIDNSGIELTARAKAGDFSIKASLTVQEPRDASQNLAQARRAKNYGSLDVSRMLSGTEFGSKLYASGARPDSNFNPGVVLPGYTTLNFYASRKIDENWTARVRLENAFDKQYQLAYGYNTPGRGLFATLQYSPK